MRKSSPHNRERSATQNRDSAPLATKILVSLTADDARLVWQVAHERRIPPATYARSALVLQAQRDAKSAAPPSSGAR